jgi:glutathione peroxidase
MSLYDLKTKTLEGKSADLSQYKGKVALVVNVASACGLTPHYTGLQKLHSELKARGFVVLGFPSNQFGAQEPGDAKQIREFCSTKYKVDFPLFEKSDVKGAGKNPVYKFLTEGRDEPDWNFTKYLVGKDGEVIKRYAPPTKPDDNQLLNDINDALDA